MDQNKYTNRTNHRKKFGMFFIFVSKISIELNGKLQRRSSSRRMFLIEIYVNNKFKKFFNIPDCVVRVDVHITITRQQLLEFEAQNVWNIFTFPIFRWLGYFTNSYNNTTVSIQFLLQHMFIWTRIFAIQTSNDIFFTIFHLTNFGLALTRPSQRETLCLRHVLLAWELPTEWTNIVRRVYLSMPVGEQAGLAELSTYLGGGKYA